MSTEQTGVAGDRSPLSAATRAPDPPAPPGDPGPPDDADLLAAVPHDAAAFEAIYRRYVRRVTGFAVTRCSDAEDVADVVAQTFVRLLGAARRYDPARGEPAAFVLGIAANVARDHQRRAARHRDLVARMAGRDLLDADDVERIDAAVDAVREAARARRALAHVPPAERQVLGLVADGHTPGQAAHHLGISAGAARTRLSRARSRVRDQLSTPNDDKD